MLSRRLLRIKALKGLYAYFKSKSDSVGVAEKNLMFSINKTYELYHQLLWLIIEVANLAEHRIELGRNKHLPTPEELNPNTRFVDNRVIAALRDSDRLVKYLDAHHLGWSNCPEVVKKLYTAFVESDFYEAYMNKPTNSFKDDVKVVEDFYVQIVDALEFTDLLEESIEEQSIFWADDLDFANIMVVRTLGTMRASDEELPLLPQYKSEDDREFVRDLFRQTCIHHKEYFEYIDKFTKNWDVERIAFMDNLIMATTMTELLTFPSIPIKVTLDEYIEISKYYSTPGSSTFINGVLDRIVEALTSEGRIEKSGRGLLEE